MTTENIIIIFASNRKYVAFIHNCLRIISFYIINHKNIVEKEIFEILAAKLLKILKITFEEKIESPKEM